MISDLRFFIIHAGVGFVYLTLNLFKIFINLLFCEHVMIIRMFNGLLSFCICHFDNDV